MYGGVVLQMQLCFCSNATFYILPLLFPVPQTVFFGGKGASERVAAPYLLGGVGAVETALLKLFLVKAADTKVKESEF